MLTKLLRLCIAFVFVCISLYSYGQAGLTYSSPARIGTASLGETFSLNPGETFPSDVAFNLTGSRMYVIGNGSDNVYEFSLSTNYDVSTASILDTLSIAGQEGGGTGIALNNTGTRMYIVGTATDIIYQYNMSAFDQSTAAYSGNSFSVTTEDGTPSDIAFSNDGFTMFMIGNSTDNVYEYTLSTAYDITTATYTGNFFSVAAQETGPSGFTFNANGNRMFVVGNGGDRIYQYNLTTEFDITTASFGGVYFSTSAQETSPEGIALSSDGTKLILVGASGDNAYGYDLSSAAFEEDGGNKGGVEGSIIMTISGETFTNAGANLTQTTDYTITNLPAGLASSIAVSSDGSSAVLSLSGAAVSNNNSNDVTLQFTFNNSAFTGGNAGLVANAIGASSGLSINFYDSLQPEIIHSMPVDVSTSIPGNTLDVSSVDTAPVGLEFSPDGMRMYLVGNTGNDITEYTLSLPYDVSLASPTGATVDITFLDSTPTDVAFNANGSRMFVSATDTDAIYEFILTTEYDISTASYTGNSLSVGTEDASPGDLGFNRDGSKLFMIGNTNDAVYEYNLSSDYDITTAVFSQSLAIGGQETSALAYEFNADGTRLIIVGSSSDRAFQYHLTTGFDLSTATYSGISFPVTETTPEGLTLSADGTQMFIVGVSSDLVRTFDMTNLAFRETGANTGQVEGSMILSVVGETFINPGGTLLSGSNYSVDNLPSGLTPTLTVNGDGSAATLTLTGTAIGNENTEDVADIQVTFNTSAFAGGTTAGSVVNAVSGLGGLAIDFNDNVAPEITYSVPSSVSTANPGATLNISTEDTAPVGLVFSPDGLKMFAVGNTTNNIIEYSLSIAFDVTTATPTGATYNMTVLDGTPTDVAFNRTGSRMFVSATDTDAIFEFSLDTEFDLSTAAYTGNFFSTASEDTGLGDLAFNRDGTKLFTIGSANDAIFEYNLSIGYDITTAVFSQSFSIVGQETSGLAFEFNADGSRLFVLGSSSDRVYEYHLTTGFDVSTAGYSGKSYSVSAENTPEALTLNADGTQFFITGVSSDLVRTYDMTSTAFRERAANDGIVEGSMIIGLAGEVFSNAGATMTSGSEYTVDNLPAGLTPTLTVNSDGLSATLTLSGTATNNDDLDDINDLQFTFTNAAFTGGHAAISVINAVGGSSNLVIDFTDNLLPEILHSAPGQVSTSIVGTTLNISAEDSAPVGLVFTPDGTKMFMVGNTGNNIYEYNLSIAYDVTTAVPTGATYNMTVLDGTPTDVAFNANGSRMYVIATDNDAVFSFHLATEYDLSTASYTGESFSVTTQDTGVGDLAFNNDGSKMFVIGSTNDAVYEYNLSVNFDITTALFSQSFLIGAQETSPLAFEFNTDGSRLFIVGSSNDRVFEYHLATGFDVSTASYSGMSFPITEATPEGLTLSRDGTQLFITGVSSDLVRTFDMSGNVFRETAANDGTVEGSMIMTVIGENFLNPGGTINVGADYTVDNLPAGLTSSVSVSADGLNATLTLSGSATSNDNLDDITDIQVTFTNTAFTGGTVASSVTNAVGGSSNLGIDFTDNLQPQILHSSPGQVSTATIGNNINISGEDTAPVGLVFSPDGLKMYAVGNTGNNIIEYDLSVSYDVSTALHSGVTYNMSVLDGTPTDVAFNANGSRMYVTGTDSDNIYAFHLSTEYSLATASYTGEFFNLATEDTGPGDLHFNQDGSKLFFIGSTNDAVYEYVLSINYDITTAVFSQSFSVATQDTNPLAMEFNRDGSRLFMVGSSTDRIHEYHLSTGFDLSTATYSGMSFPVSEATPEGLTMNRNGTQLFVTGVSSDLVQTYDLSFSAFRETAANDGTVEGSMIIELQSETFLNPGGSLFVGSNYTVDNIPAGLTPNVAVAADGLSATLTLTGAATNNDNLDDLTDVQMTFTDASFTGGTLASGVINAVGGTSGLAIDFTDNLLPEVSFAMPIEVSTATYDVGLNVSLEDAGPSGLTITPDGLKMFMTGNNTNNIIEYTLTVAFDVSTAAPTGAVYNMTVLEGTPTDVTFNANGSRMYVIGLNSDAIYTFALSTEYDISTAAYTGQTFSVAAEDTSPTDLEFNSDGSKLFMIGNNLDAVYEYNLGVNYDITTAVWSRSFSIVGQEGAGNAMAFNADGTKLFVTGSVTDRVFEYHLTTGFDLSTATYSGISFPLSFETSPEGLALSPDGTRLFITGSGTDSFHSYSLSSTAVRETAANDGTVEGSMIMSLQAESFANPGGTLTNGTHYSVDNLPAGLMPNVTVAADGLSGVLTFTGSATNNDNIDDVPSIQMTFTDAAFTGGTLASGVTNAVAGSSNLAIDFTGNLSPEVAYSSPVNIATASLGAQFSVTAEETSPSGLEFGADGFKLYVTGNTGNDVTEYDLIVAYDVTTASFSGVTYDLSLLDGTPTDIAFNPSGSRMFVSGLDNDNIHEFVLSTEFDLSTATYTGRLLNVSSQDGQPGDFAFNQDGSRLFMAGSLNDSIYQYDLTINYDITTATFLSAFYIGAQENNVLGMEFNADGSRMFILGSNTDRVIEYHLSTAFDVSTATYSGLSYNTGNEETLPEGMTLSPDGTQLFTIGVNSDMVTTYQLSSIVFQETGANNGTLEGAMVVDVIGEAFANPGGALADGIDYTVDNLPSGLTPLLSVAGDGLSAQLTLTGSATNNSDIDDVNNIQLTFTNTAFSGGTAAASVANAVAGISNLQINFSQNPTPEIVYSTYSDVSTAVVNTTFDASTEETNLTGVVFNNDGSRMFITGSSDNVHQYDLTTNYDISTAVFNATINILDVVGNPNDLAFNPDGSRLFIVGQVSSTVYEYVLDIPFEITSASYTGTSFFVGGEDATVTGIHFSNNGQDLYTIGNVNNAVFHYSLIVPYDLNTASYTGNSFSVFSQSTDPNSIDFNADGSQMIVDGIEVFVYDLSVNFDITTATYNGVFYDAAAEQSFTSLALLAENDTRLIIGGTFDGLLTSYDLTTQGNFTEAPANDGSVEGTMVARIIGDEFSNPSGTLTDATDFSIVNLPAGLTPVLDVAPGGTTVRITFTGNATANNSADAVGDISITFENTAFIGGNAASIANAIAGTSGVGIDFDDNVNVVAFAASNITSSSFQANWTGGVDVQEYRIDISEQSDFSTFFDGYQDFSVGLATNVVVSTADFGTDYYYRVRYTDNSSNVSTDSNVIMVTTTTDQGTLDDFAALTDIYNAMDGANWTVNTGWLSTRLRDWTLITLDANQRVTTVDLSGNNLSGALPDILLGLELLTDLNLNGNAIDGLGDISNLTALTNLDVSFNHLEFDDLEPIAPLGIATFTYSDQLSLQFDPETDPNFLKDFRGETVRIVPHTDPYTISVTTGGANNQYAWLVDGNAISTDADYTLTNGTADITAINYDNMGQFSAQVTNTLLPNLTLFVDPESVLATADVAMTITDFSNNALADNISGYLLEAFRRASGFDTLERADDVGSSFIFSDVVLGDYLCSIDPSNRALFIPSYYGDVFEWDEADTLFLRANENLTVRVTAVPTEPLTGDGVLDVLIEEDFGDTGGRIDARRRAAGRKCGLKKRRSGGRTDQDIYDLIAYGETDENGEFQFGELPEGVYRFFVEYPGIPLDQSSFVEFEVGEQGVSDTEFKLTAFASETGLEISIERVLGLILEYFKNLEIYPNPSDEFVNIRYRHLKSKDVTGQLVDLSGNTLWSQDLQSGFDGRITIDVTGFEEGVYILRFYDRTSRDENVVSYRIIVNK